MQLPIRVLQVTIGDGSFGGVASFLYNYYSHMDHCKVHFDFLYCGENSMQTKEGDPVLEGSSITTLHILKRHDNGLTEYKKLLPALKKVFEENKYDIVHVNSGNLFLNICVAYALRGRAKLISHSHGTQAITETGSKWKSCVKTMIRKPCIAYVIKKADALFACSEIAGLSLFGEKGTMSDKFRLIRNAIDISKYTYKPSIREKVRDGEERMIVGHVGRLTYVKNPFFILEVFLELHKMNPATVLWMIGEGELKQEIEKRIVELKLSDSVKLLGQRNDVANLMQGMDVFLFPSLHEGLSIVTIEAQTAGLPVFASNSISPEHKVTDLVTFLPITESPGYWATKIMNLMSEERERRNTESDLIKEGYQIENASKTLEEIYIGLTDSEKQIRKG